MEIKVVWKEAQQEVRQHSFHSGDPGPGCTLCTVHCTSVHSHVDIYKRWSLSFAFVSDVFVPILQCALHWQQLSKRFCLRYRLEIYKLFVLFFLLEVGRSYHSTQFWTRLFGYSYFCSLSLCSFRPWADIQPSTHFLYQVNLTLFVIFILCMSHSALHYNFLFQFYLALFSLCIVLPHCGYHILSFLGPVPIKPLHFDCFF